MTERGDGSPGANPAGGAVGAGSARDGLVGVYAERLIERGVDARPLVGELWGAPFGATRREPAVPQGGSRGAPPVRRVGRGTAAHRAATRRPRRPVAVAVGAAGLGEALDGLGRGRPGRSGRRLVAVACAVALLLGGGLGAAAAEPPPQQRYAAQPGDSLDGIAAEFGVDPAAIAAASGLDDPAALQPAQIVVIPAPGQTPEDAARMAAELHGTSPFAVGAHLVAPGETLVGIAAGHGVTPAAVAEFNALTAPDALTVGQRLLIPPPEGVGGAGTPAGVFVPGVPTYVQQRNLSCEYAAAYIATSAFGAGVPEEAFLATVPQARNPHWGYRGNIDGWWGNTDDYGVYAEALVPTLEANGFAAEVFYGGGDPEALRARIDIGKPVVTWLGYWGDTGVTLEDEGVYTVAAGMHVVVAYGYDEGGVHVSNPARGTYEYFPWADFSAMWSVLDGMGLAVAPAE